MNEKIKKEKTPEEEGALDAAKAKSHEDWIRFENLKEKIPPLKRVKYEVLIAEAKRAKESGLPAEKYHKTKAYEEQLEIRNDTLNAEGQELENENEDEEWTKLTDMVHEHGGGGDLSSLMDIQDKLRYNKNLNGEKPSPKELEEAREYLVRLIKRNSPSLQELQELSDKNALDMLQDIVYEGRPGEGRIEEDMLDFNDAQDVLYMKSKWKNPSPEQVAKAREVLAKLMKKYGPGSQKSPENQV